MQNIYHRTSVRKYTEDRVERSRIMQILRAAMAAPSAGNQQPWEFFVVRDPETIRKLSEVHPYAGCAAGANVVIVSAYREDVQMPEYAQIDMSIAMENLWLETDAQGLGGVWLGIAPIEERMQKVEEILGMRRDSARSPSSRWDITMRSSGSRTASTEAGSTLSRKCISDPHWGSI